MLKIVKTVTTLGLHKRSRGFLSQVEQFETETPAGLGLICHYDHTRFDVDLFAALDCVRPDHLEGAIAKRQSEHLAGRALAQSSLKLRGLQPATIPRGAAGAPQWPQGVMGSISHSKGTCICLTYPSSQALVGVDIETIATSRAMDAIIRMAMNPKERDLLDTQSQFTKPFLVTLLFSAKETLFKLLFPVVGRYFGFPSAELRVLPDMRTLRLYLTCDLHPDLPKGAFFDLKYEKYGDHIVTWAIVEQHGANRETASS